MNKKTSALNLSQRCLPAGEAGISLGLERSYQRLFSVIKKTPLDNKHLTGQAKNPIRVIRVQFEYWSRFIRVALVGSLFLIGGVLGFGGSAEAEVFVNEGFEDGTFSPPYQYLCDPNDPGSPPQTGPCTNTAEHVMTEKKSGNYSLECVFNMAQAAGLRIFPADYRHTDFGNKTYIRFYMKWDSAFRSHNRTKVFRWSVPGDDIYMNINACGTDGVTWVGWWQGESSCSQYGDLYFTRTNQSPSYYVTNEMGNSDWVIEAGTGWYMFEFFYDASTTNFALWVMRPGDEAPTQVINQYFGGPTSSAGNGVININWINSVSDGSGGKLWIDEIVIADEYIGPINTPDTTPPSRSNPQPTGTLSSGTTSTTISLDTNETAVCKYSTAANTAYDDMTLQLSSPQPSSGQATHSATVSNLEDGNSYTYYVRCQDESGNANSDDFEISFSIASHTIYSISNFINLVTNWLKSESGLESDVNGDGLVNTRDLGIMMSNWGE